MDRATEAFRDRVQLDHNSREPRVLSVIPIPSQPAPDFRYLRQTPRSSSCTNNFSIHPKSCHNHPQCTVKNSTRLGFNSSSHLILSTSDFTSLWIQLLICKTEIIFTSRMLLSRSNRRNHWSAYPKNGSLPLPGVQFSQPHHHYQLTDTEPVNTLPIHVATLQRRTWSQILSAYYVWFPRNSRATSLAVWLGSSVRYQRSSFWYKSCYPWGVFEQTTWFIHHQNFRIFCF